MQTGCKPASQRTGLLRLLGYSIGVIDSQGGSTTLSGLAGVNQGLISD
jgi:hypothetical protein